MALESVEDPSAFIIEDEDDQECGVDQWANDPKQWVVNGRGGPGLIPEVAPPAPQPPALVRKMLNLRKRQVQEEERALLSEDFRRENAMGQGAAFALEDVESRLAAFYRTEKYAEFYRRAEKVSEAAAAPTRGQERLFEMKTYLDLRCYELENTLVDPPRARVPGSLQMLYMFYARLYPKLIQKQRGKDLRFFEPIDLDAELLGFREILDFGRDFHLTPTRLYVSDLQRIFCAIVGGTWETTEAAFAKKLNYQGFVEFFATMADYMEANDKDPIAYKEEEFKKITRVRKVAHLLRLPHMKELKLRLHNLYRDVHFWRLHPDEEFVKVARSEYVKSIPLKRVRPIEQKWRVDPISDEDVMRYLRGFTWLEDCVTGQWEAFDAPILDLGTCLFGGPKKRFKMVLTNCKLHPMRFSLEAQDFCPLRMPCQDVAVSPGQQLEVPIEPVPIQCGEFSGLLKVRGDTVAGEVDEVDVPLYCRVAMSAQARKEGGPKVDLQLPLRAPHPWRQQQRGSGLVPSTGEQMRLELDMLCSKNLRKRTPGSASSARPRGRQLPARAPWAPARVGQPRQPPSGWDKAHDGEDDPRFFYEGGGAGSSDPRGGGVGGGGKTGVQLGVDVAVGGALPTFGVVGRRVPGDHHLGLFPVTGSSVSAVGKEIAGRGAGFDRGPPDIYNQGSLAHGMVGNRPPVLGSEGGSRGGSASVSTRPPSASYMLSTSQQLGGRRSAPSSAGNQRRAQSAGRVRPTSAGPVHYQNW